MGSGDNDSMAASDERPQATVNLDGFWIMRTEVTNEQYRRCVEDNQACSEPSNDRWNDPAHADHPVTDVDWYQANDYAAWAGGRLPTEAEWEKACRGEGERIYPWGNSVPTAALANFGGSIGTMPVGSYSPQGDSPYALVDMAGNVWEWTSSKYQDYPYAAADGRENLEGDASRTLRGGAWNYDVAYVRCAYRLDFNPVSRFYNVGFRVVSNSF
jgi:formylglycine-generating enzyme required for sulfatase activity